jgi:predicted nucleic acid-binding protein
VKLPLREPEHEALRAELARWEGFVSSALIAVEAVRACARYGDEYAAAALGGLDSLALLPIDEAVLARARTLEPSDLRSLDAIHLATALSIEDDLGTLISYDDRLGEAARAHGLTVVSPR